MVVPRIVQAVDDGRQVRLAGNVYPALRTATDLGMVSSELRMDRLQLVLQRSPEQQAALDRFMGEQLDPTSPNFHHWLSPEQFGQLYGVADGDIATITGWLQARGFAVNSVSRGRIAIEFSGTAGQVETAFHTEIHNYTVAGEAHIANSSDPQIPEALAPVVTGILSLHNFFAKSQAIVGQKLQRDPATGRYTPRGTPTPTLTTLGTAGKINPQYNNNNNGTYYVSPYDFATIYNSLPLWSAGLNGAGVTIAIAGRTIVKASDIATFQLDFGLPRNPPTFINNGPLPSTGVDATENTLDVEWAGAAAPGAKISLVISASTSTTDGSTLSELYIIDNQVAPIMSASYGLCELGFGTSGNALTSAMWQQGAAEGISIFVSAGDQASAGCDNSNASTPYTAKFGLQVNGLASTPYTTAVGGTDFADFQNYATYWNSTNSANGSSVKGYIPEIPWNDMCTNPTIATALNTSGFPPEEACNSNYKNGYTYVIQTVGGSGGVSGCTASDGSTVASCTGGYPKPAWQKGIGVPPDGKRDLPDVSLFAAGGFLGNAYIIVDGGFTESVGGTSVSSPAMAGLMAMVVQKQGAAQGLANPVLYQLAANETLANCNTNSVAAGNACVFYDITTGNITPPCATATPNCVSNPSDPYYVGLGVLSGYNATTGYDLATGLGSMNAANLVNSWNTVATTPAVTVALTPATLSGAAVGTTYSQQLTASGGTPPYFYSVTSGALPPWMTLSPTGLLSGVPTLVSSYTFTISARDSSVSGPYAGSQSYSQTVIGAGASVITWVPSTLTTYTGLPLGAGVLDATSTIPGTFTYTETLMGGGPAVSVTPTTNLAAGNYTLTATLTPTVGGTTSTATIPFNVLVDHVWVVNSSGYVVDLDAGGNVLKSSAAGGMGMAIDNNGAAWSGNVGGTSLTTFANSGVIYGPIMIASGASYGGTTTGGGLSSPSAIAVDGNGYIWVADSASSAVSQFTNAGVAVSPSTGFTGGNMSTPSGIAIDMSGNVWISNAGNNSVTEILGAAAPVAPLAAAVNQNSLGVKP